MAGTLKARVSGAWVPVIGSGQEAAAVVRANSPWGIVAVGSVNSGNPLTIPTTADTQITGNLVFTMQTGRRYRIVLAARALASTGALTYVGMKLRDATTNIVPDYVLFTAPPSQYSVVYYEWLFTGDGVSRSLNVTAISGAVATGLTTNTGAAFYVEDMGPVTPAAIAPPTAGPYVVASGNALGIVAMGSMAYTAAQTLATNGTLDITNALVFTPQLGRRYRLQMVIRAISNNASGHVQATPFLDGNNNYGNWGDRYIQVYGGTGSGYAQFDCYWEFDGDGVQHSYVIRLNNGSTGNPIIYPSPGCLFYIEDCGPNQSPALPLSATPPAWTPLTLMNSWTQTSGWATCRYQKVGDRVYVEGHIQAPASASAGVAQLPVGFRPPKNIQWISNAYNASATKLCYITVQASDGQIAIGMLPQYTALASGDTIPISMIQYSVTP